MQHLSAGSKKNYMLSLTTCDNGGGSGNGGKLVSRQKSVKRYASAK